MDTNALKDILDKIYPELNNSNLFNFTEDELISIYNSAVKNMDVGNYDKAVPLLQLVVSSNSKNATFNKALAACYQKLKRYDLAIVYYQFTYFIDEIEQADCLFYCGVCSYEANNHQKSAEYFNNFIASEFDSEALFAKAQLYLKAIENKNK